MYKRECYESRKNYLDESEVKSPTLFYNGQSAAKFRIGKGSTTIPCCGEVGLQAIGNPKR